MFHEINKLQDFLRIHKIPSYLEVQVRDRARFVCLYGEIIPEL